MPEYWDICDENGIPTGRIHQKGTPMNPDEYHMAVTVWILNRKGEFLLSRRVPAARHNAGFWEPTCGSALAGEDSLAAACREVREELGLTLDPSAGTVFDRYNWPHLNGSGMVHFCVWVFRGEFSLDEVILQPTETCDARWADEDTIRTRIREGVFVPYSYLDKLFAFCRNLPDAFPD